MRRIIAMTLAFLLVISLSPNVSAGEEQAGEEPADLLVTLGCISNDMGVLLKAGGVVTRGQLAAIVAGLMRIEDERGPAKEIEALTRYGILKGDLEGNFYPDNPVSGMDALVVLLRVLGYEEFALYSGGYPTGYYLAEQRTAITKKISGFSYEAPVTGRILSRMLKNLIDEKIFEVLSVSESNLQKGQSERTFLSLYHGIDKISGIVSGNTETLLDRPVKNGGLIVGGRLLETSSREFDGFLGLTADAYYYRDSDSLLCVVPATQNKFFTVKEEEITGFDGNHLLYTNENGKSKSVSLPVDAHFIYNGRAAESLLQEIFHIVSGSVELIDSDGNGDVEVIKILNYEAVVVDSVNVFENSILLKYGAGSLSDQELGDCPIFDKNGETDLSWLHEWDALNILRSESREITAIYRGGDIKTGVPKEIIEADHKKSVQFEDGGLYPIYKGSLERFEDLKLGESVIFSVDMFGNIVSFVSNTKDKLAYLVAAATVGEIDKSIQIKLYTEEEEFITFTLPKRIILNNESRRLENEAVLEAVSNELKPLLGHLVEFHMDSLGDIKQLNALEILYSSNGMPVYIFANKNSNVIVEDGVGATYIRQDAKAFYVPDQAADADETNTRVHLVSSIGGTPSLPIIAYRRIGETAPEASAVILSSYFSSGMGEYDQPSLVEAISQIYDEENGMVVSKMTYWYLGAKRTANAKKEELFQGIGPGDVVYVALDSNGIASEVIQYYDFSENTLSDGYIPQRDRSKHRRQIGYVYQTFQNLYTLALSDPSIALASAETHRYPIYGYVFDTKRNKVSKARQMDFVGFEDHVTEYSKVFVFSTYMTDYMAVIYK